MAMARALSALSAALGLALSCGCSSGRPHATAIAAEPAKASPSTNRPEPSTADRPAAAAPVLSASSVAPASREGPPNGGSFIEVVLGNERKLLDAPCAANFREMDHPYLEVLDPNTASPRVILDACGSKGFYFDIVGRAVKLPGPVTPMQLRISDVRTNEEWEASDVKFEVTSFDAPGKMVSGTFSGTMSPRLNRDAVPIHGKFSVVRAPDRYAP
jgi:hypothetical protein